MATINLEWSTVEDLIKDGESLELEPYIDIEGHGTIGWGTKLPLTREECDVLLIMRMNMMHRELEQRLFIYREVSKTVRAVLLDIAYNVGVEGLLGFRKMIGAFAANDHYEAALQIYDSKYREQTNTRAERNIKIISEKAWRELYRS